ncbi:hypothetical protein [Morganella psychrotolerans]|uniref:hypothetical protein n=1 Tax=Morganella psychrotolerans TaxID=368603 RepID=UPI0039AEE72D
MPIVIGVVDKTTRITKKAGPSVKNGVSVLKAIPGVDYVLVDKQTGAAPQKVIMVRDGNNLKLFLMGEEEPSIIIEDYYLVPGQIIGETAGKQVHDYTPQSAVEHDNIGNMADKQASVQQQGDKILAPITWESSGIGWELLAFLGLTAAAGAAVAVSKDHKSGDNHNNDDSSNGNTDSGSKDNGNTGKEPGTDGKEPDTDGKEPGTDGKEPGTDGKEPGTDGKEPGTDGKEPGTDGKEPGTDGKEPGTDGKEPGTDGKDDGNTDISPAITTVVNIDAVTDSGLPDPENPVVTPVLSGHIEGVLSEDQTVTVFRDGIKIGHATVNDDGKWTFNDVTGRFEESHTYNYTACVEGNGLTGPDSDVFKIMYDTTGQHDGTELPVQPENDDVGSPLLPDDLLSDNEDSLTVDHLLQHLPGNEESAVQNGVTEYVQNDTLSPAEFIAHDMVSPDLTLLAETHTTLF